MKNKFVIIFLTIGLLNLSCDDHDLIVDSRDNPDYLDTDRSDLPTDERREECLMPDAAITAITIDYSSFPPFAILPGTDIKFSYTFETSNLGRSPFFLSKDVYFQTYLSKDRPSAAEGIPAGGAEYLNIADSLSHGQAFTRGWANYSGADLHEYKYLIVEVKSKHERFIECTLSNNYFVQYIDVPRLGDHQH
jgi:hypothetical protein